MNCHQFAEIISPYLDGELESHRAAEVDEHLASCVACSAELEVLQGIDTSIATTAANPSAPPAWDRMARRLTKNSPTIAPPTRSRRIARFGAFAAVAAVIFLMVWRASPENSPDGPGPRANSQRMDVQSVFNEDPQRRMSALETWIERMGGRETSIAAESSPWKNLDAMPNGAKHLTTRVVRLPHCDCPPGECHCGPNGCQCAASVYRREDGSTFVVMEHCKSQKLYFGDLERRIVDIHGIALEWAESRNQLAVSWVRGSDRLTLIGMNDQHEVEAVVQALNEIHGLN